MTLWKLGKGACGHSGLCYSRSQDWRFEILETVLLRNAQTLDGVEPGGRRDKLPAAFENRLLIGNSDASLLGGAALLIGVGSRSGLPHIELNGTELNMTGLDVCSLVPEVVQLLQS